MSRRQHASPLLVQGGEATLLKQEDFSDKVFREEWLQELLFRHPSLIPVKELEPAFGPLLPLAREVRSSAGPVDLVCISPTGMLTLVETKLWRNPQARREVVAQIIDYAKAMSRWSYEELVGSVRSALGALAVGDPVLEAASRASENIDEAMFIDQVGQNLERGRFLLVIVGDGIQEGVEQMAEFLQGAPQLGFTLALVELAVFRVGEEGLLVLPRTLARTQEVKRAIIEVRAPSRPSDVTIAVPAETEDRHPGSRSRSRITEEVFFERLLSAAGPSVAEFVRKVLPALEERGLELEWTDVSVMYKFETDGAASFSLGGFSVTGKFRLGVTLMGACRSAGVPAEVIDRYVAGLLTLMPGAVRQPRGTGGIRMWQKDGKGEPPIEWLIGKDVEFIKIVDDVIADLERSLESKPS